MSGLSECVHYERKKQPGKATVRQICIPIEINTTTKK